jgi:hypothetical protein
MREPFDLPLGRHGGEGAGGGTSGACETGHTITPRQLLLRTAGRLVPLVYYWFTLEGRLCPPLEPPPTNGAV